MTARQRRRAAGSGVATDPHIASVRLLLHFGGADASTTFTDSSPYAEAVTASGNAQIDTAQSKFGGSSGLFDGTGDYLFVDGDTDFAFGTGDFTIEAFIRRNASGAVHVLYDSRSGATDNHPLFYVNASNVLIFHGFNATRITGTTTISTGTWYHVAVSRVSGTTRMFLDGVQEGSSYTDSNNYGNNGTNRPILCADRAGAQAFNGWMDELRVTVGVGRYSAGFTPPSAAFPDI